MATATNPKARKGRSKKSTEPKENTDMTDTAPAPEAEAPVEEPTTEAPAAEDNESSGSDLLSSKSDVAPEDALYDAIVKYGNDRDTASLQETYRSVHASSRGKAQGVAMKRAMTEGNVDMDVLGEVLDAFNNLPAASKTSRTKPTIDEGTVKAIRLTGLMVAFENLRQELGDEAYNVATEWFGGNAPEEHQSQIDKVADGVTKASEKGVRGRGGNRTSYSDTIADLVGRGTLTAGQVLKGANDVTATVTEDGKLETAGESFDNPSAAARAHRSKEDGKSTSTNGWDFWQTEDGKSIGELREG